MASTADTPRVRQLGVELKALRTASGLTTSKLGIQVGRTHAHVSRWENGKLLPTEKDMVAMLAVFGVIGKERERLLALARDAADPNWIAPGIGRAMSVLMEYERTALRIFNVEPLLIPGLLQTADYARSIMLTAGKSRGEAEQRVVTRMGRREVLVRRDPVEFHAFVGEHALRYPPCDGPAMVEQLHQLLAMAERNNVTMRAVPFGHGYSPMLEGPFVLLEFDRTKPVVQMEHYRSTATITDARDVADYQGVVATLDEIAMSEEATSDLIARLADGMEHE
jgi:transcriptional regulator with XRE-family HTH domain